MENLEPLGFGPLHLLTKFFNVTARHKSITRPSQHNAANIDLGTERLEHRYQLVQHCLVQRIQHSGTVEGDIGHMIMPLDKNWRWGRIDPHRMGFEHGGSSLKSLAPLRWNWFPCFTGILD
jgi:hypothetical protein